MSQRYLFGPVAALADHLPELEPSAILILASSQRHVSALFRPLAAYETHVFDGAKVHVPVEVVEAAEARLAETGANVVVAIGGGSPIGLGKALVLRAAEAGRTLRFVAVPTTYAGSENTSMYGITRGRDKQTGRDERVRPEIIVADVELTLDLPLVLTVQSLMNSIAHVASVLSTDSLPFANEPHRALESSTDAATAARTVVATIERLIADPRDRDARSKALIYAGACAKAFDRGKAGVQHAFAHLLGGAFRIDHAPLHSILLPRFLAHVPAVRTAIENAPVGSTYGTLARAALGIGEAALYEQSPVIDDRGGRATEASNVAGERATEASNGAGESATEASNVAGERDRRSRSSIAPLDAHLLDLLRRAGAPTTLGELGITATALDEVLATRPELPGDIARAAL